MNTLMRSRRGGIALVVVGAVVVLVNRGLAWTNTWGPNLVGGLALFAAVGVIVLGVRIVSNAPKPAPAQRRRHALTGWAAVLFATVLAGATVAAWWLWLGHDTAYQHDPRTGVASGPYEAPQVIACGATILLLAVVGAALLPDWHAPVIITAAFTVAWSTRAANASDGLWGVGALMVAVGVGLGATGVATAVQHFWPVRASGLRPDGRSAGT